MTKGRKENVKNKKNHAVIEINKKIIIIKFLKIILLVFNGLLSLRKLTEEITDLEENKL